MGFFYNSFLFNSFYVLAQNNYSKIYIQKSDLLIHMKQCLLYPKVKKQATKKILAQLEQHTKSSSQQDETILL